MFQSFASNSYAQLQDEALKTKKLHDLVLDHGPEETVRSAESAVLAREESLDPQLSLLDALAGRSGRRIADTALSAVVREAEGRVAPGHSYSAWSLTGLPHRDIPLGTDWRIRGDFADLVIRPGIRIEEEGEEQLGVPFGTIARLLLIDWQSRSIETNSREIYIGKSPAELANRMGLGRGGPTNNRLREQLERLVNCTITFRFGKDDAGVIVNERIVEAYKYSGKVDPRSKSKTRWIERIVLSEAYFNELKKHPVRIDREAIKDIQTSPQAIDAYLWLAFRLHVLQSDTFVSWPSLWKSFGHQYKLLRTFKREFLEPFSIAHAAYPNSRVDISERGITLKPSPPPVPLKA
ncbi:MAG: replication protein RepA [Gluconobacter potus]|uniref:Plasmid replication protein n=1 Tax=Gluconobacter potus TaxID=2724927 RepID=A0ABR9YQ67_9PROT|nr:MULTISPECIES: replication protein RepA [Gluconobacter]MBS1081699.1 plasmid replication protein [Gluconobacter kondonii]MBS1104152.1 plasmid replication protein [Gluconobacter sp. Dm-62]MBF0865958.1 plasmid replication protein [Gluconobacter sp. R71656]MBF0868644.1 plasmid replication protein [Gluconobacter sp. R75628]MBF0874626.1 plasmid replication protein [Gluconobacter sp. R75629]